MSQVIGRPSQIAKARRRKTQASSGDAMQSSAAQESRVTVAGKPRRKTPRGSEVRKRKLQRYLQKGKGRVAFESKTNVDEYVRRLAGATPLETVEIERVGVRGSLFKELSKRMGIPSSRMFVILGVPKATAEKKAATNEMVSGRGGQAAIGMVKLLGIAQELVDSSTASEAKDFDAARWLGEWIERPQPSLGGRKPADLLDTPTGTEVVARLLGSIASGAYQ